MHFSCDAILCCYFTIFKLIHFFFFCYRYVLKRLMLQFHSTPNSVSGRGTVIALEEAEAEKRYVAPRTLPFVFFGRLVVFFYYYFFQMHFFCFDYKCIIYLWWLVISFILSDVYIVFCFVCFLIWIDGKNIRACAKVMWSSSSSGCRFVRGSYFINLTIQSLI